MKKLILLLLLVFSGVQAQDIVKSGVGFNVVQGTSRYFTIDKPNDNITLTVLDSGATYTDTLRLWAVFQDNTEQLVRLWVVNQFARTSDSLMGLTAAHSSTFYVNTGGAKTFIIEHANKEIITGRRSIVIYSAVSSTLNPTGSNSSGSIDLTAYARKDKTNRFIEGNIFTDSFYVNNGKTNVARTDTVNTGDINITGAFKVNGTDIATLRYTKAEADLRFLHSSDSTKYFTTLNQDTTLTGKLPKYNIWTNVNNFTVHTSMGYTATNPYAILAIGSSNFTDTAYISLTNIRLNQERTTLLKLQDTSSVTMGITPQTGKPWFKTVGPTGATFMMQDTTGLFTLAAGLTLTGGSVTLTTTSSILFGFTRSAISSPANGTISIFASNGTDYSSLAMGRLKIETGTNKSSGSATLLAGTVTVANTSIVAGSVIMTFVTTGSTLGSLSYTVNAGVGFTINSTDNTDTRTIQYVIVDKN